MADQAGLHATTVLSPWPLNEIFYFYFLAQLLLTVFLANLHNLTGMRSTVQKQNFRVGEIVMKLM